MQRVFWRIAGRTGFSSLLLWGCASMAASTSSFETLVTQAGAQEPAPRPEKQPQIVTPQNASSVNSKPTTNSGKTPQIVNGATNLLPPVTPQVSNSARPTLQFSARQTAMLQQSNAERIKDFRSALDTAATSDELCKEMFDRGLMPLSDFAEQASANLEIRLAIADLQNDRTSRVRALSDHLDLMKTAAKQLQEFNQPAAKGWAADTDYIALLASNAEMRLAVTRGDKVGYEEAVEQSSKLAEDQFAKRLADFQTGQASLSLLSTAASYLTTATGVPAERREKDGEPTKYEEYLSTLDDVVTQTEKFGELGAGIGREDRLFQAQFELSKATGQAAVQKQNFAEAATAFDQAADSAKDWFESEMKFYQTGTATLRDITQAWWGAAELTDRSERAGLIANSSTQESQAADLDRLQKLVAGTEDQQGRIAADIAYVNSLEKLDNLWARQRAVDALAALKKTATTKQTRTGGGSKIIEINAQSNIAPDSKTIPGTIPTETQPQKNSSVEIVRPKRSPK
ncbi:MAG: hypothetical protein JWM11_3488 [Planctomycetaceae bacterium]|nr:hypothetical protein [Planctomycetaceae bacterium]